MAAQEAFLSRCVQSWVGTTKLLESRGFGEQTSSLPPFLSLLQPALLPLSAVASETSCLSSIVPSSGPRHGCTQVTHLALSGLAMPHDHSAVASATPGQ